MMKLIIPAVLAALVGCAGTPPVESADSDAAFEAALAGFEQSGPAVACVDGRILQGNTWAGDGAILFRTAASHIYINRPNGGCPALRYDNSLAVRSFTNRLCNGDVGSITSRSSEAQFGTCVLGDFTPYRRVKGS